VKTVASLYFLVAPAIAQTITPITTESAASGIPWYAWAGLAAAVAAIAYVVLKKKDPAVLTTVTTSGSNVVSELTSLLHKAADTAKTTAATIQSQAAVIAAPAVQAAVNAVPASVAPVAAVVTSLNQVPQSAPQFTIGAPMADPNGPPRSNNQSFPLDTGRGWWVSPQGSNPPGYVYDLPWPKVGSTSTAQAGSATAPSSPYAGIGLDCVISLTGNTQTMRTNAEQAIEAGAAPYTAAQWHATNDNADPTWTAAVSQVVVGIDPTVAFANVSQPGQAPVGGLQFTLVQLQAAVPVINSFR
jgi:hypothetical protein